MKDIQELDVYRLAEQLADLLWSDYDGWPPKAQHTIGTQAIRAADSIAANLAEGFGRFTPADRKRFYLYARGSFEESKCWLRKAIRREVLADQARIVAYTAILDELGPKLNGFIRATSRERAES